MTLRMNKPVHKLISKSGAVMWLPQSCFTGNFSLAVPDVYTQDSAQQYPLGSKLEYCDGRIFRYGKVGATNTQVPMARLVVNANANPAQSGDADVDGFYGDLYTAAVVGDEYLDLEKSTAYAENFFEDGMVTMFSTSHYVEYRICGSELGNGTYCRIYLEAPLKTAHTASQGLSAYKSIYSQLKAVADEGWGYTAAMGMCLASGFTADYFVWIQRRGRCAITQSGWDTGDAAGERVCQMTSDGTIVLKAADSTQPIGYLVNRTQSGTADMEFWLTIE